MMDAGLRAWCLFLLVLLFGGTVEVRLPAQAVSPSQVVVPPPPSADPPELSPEFPAIERFAWSQHRESLVALRRAQRAAGSPDSPEGIEARILLGPGEARVAALHLLVERYPERLPGVFEALDSSAGWVIRGIDPARGVEAYRDLLTAIRQRLPDLRREDAAQIAYRVAISLEELADSSGRAGDYPGRLRAFLREYGDTAIARLAEVDLAQQDVLATFRTVSGRSLEPLDRLARAQAGTVAGAKALLLKGFRLAADNTPGADPLERFLQVEQIVRELQSGTYPPCEWVDKAPDLIIQFFTDQPAYAPGSADRMLEGYRAFALEHFTRITGGEADGALTFVVGSQMGELFAERGEAMPAIERAFADLERINRPRARYLSAEFHISRMLDEPDFRSAALRQALDILRGIVKTGGRGFHERKALAALVSLQYHEGEYEEARDRARQYVRQYPSSEFSWLATLMMARADERLGNVSAAREAYRRAAADFSGLPMARVLAHVYAARASEALGEFQQAADEYEVAMADPYPWHTFHLGELPYAQTFDRVYDASAVTREGLQARLEQLRGATRPGGALVERGRWLLDRGEPGPALASLSEALARFPESPLAADARYLAHRARVETALELGSDDLPKRDEAAAIRELDAVLGEPSASARSEIQGRATARCLAEAAGRRRTTERATSWDMVQCGEPYDFGVFAAQVAKATMLWKQGRAGADTLLLEALGALYADQQRRVATPTEAIERDVASIRGFLFRPQGSEVFSGLVINAFDWPATPPPFSIVNADVTVKLPSGETSRRTVSQSFPDVANVLIVTTEQIELLDKIITKLGGSRKRTPTAIMETPNQPIGASRDILSLWSRYFHARPGHWSGWELLTYPVITGIEFVDPERTQALVDVTIGYSGGTMLLSRTGSTWSLVRIVNQWIT